MPRSKVGVQSMRIENSDSVYILSHRLAFVAWRTHRFSERQRIRTLDTLKANEKANVVYRVTTLFYTGITGTVNVSDKHGNTYTAHHTDLIRV